MDSSSFGQNIDNDENETKINQDKMQFLESIVSQYESLVQEMHAKLVQSCQDVASHLVTETGDSDVKNHDLQDLKLELSRKDTIIENLLTQLDTTFQAKLVSKKLWEVTLEHVEQLESTKQEYQTQPNQLLPSPDFLTQWKTLISYVNTLEQHAQHLTKDLHFYQGKVVEICARHEKLEEIRQAEEALRTEEITKGLRQEVQQLQSSKEQWRNKFELFLKKRLEKEKKAWEFQEFQTLRLIRVQMKELLLDNQAYQKRETELVDRVHKLEKEIQHWRWKLEIMISVAHASEQLKQIIHSSEVLVPTNTTNIIPEAQMVVKVPATAQTESIDQTERTLSIQHQLMEMKRHNSEIRAAETNALEKVNMLQIRIQQVESLNLALNAQYLELNEKYENIMKKSGVVHDTNVNRKVSENKDALGLGLYTRCQLSSNKNIYESKNPDLTKSKSSAILKVNDIHYLELECKRINGKRKDMEISKQIKEVERLRQKQNKLLEVIQEQSVICCKWKLEFKELAKTTLLTTSSSHNVIQ